MRESGTKQERISIPYFEGVNSTVQHVIAKRTELAHMENARAPIIGVLEKREGQTVLGTAIDGGVFESLGNFGLVYWVDGGNESQGLLRITSVNGSVANIYFLTKDLSPTRYDSITVTESVDLAVVDNTSLFESITITENIALIVSVSVSPSEVVTITENFASNIV